MQYELDFYGITVFTYVNDGFVSIHRRSLAQLFNVTDNDEALAPLLPFIHGDRIMLAALEKNFRLMSQDILSGAGENPPEEVTNLLLILKNELVENLIKQLTYAKHILPLVHPGSGFKNSGIFTQKVGIEGEFFTALTVARLTDGAPTMRLPEDVPFRHLIVQDESWSFEKQRPIHKNVLLKVIDMKYLTYVLDASEGQKKLKPKFNPYPHTCGE